MLAVCIRCGSSYSLDEYQNNRFCRKCGTLLKIQNGSEPKKGQIEKIDHSNYSILSVMGPYAGESINSIFNRKIQEIQNTGFTFWHHQSYQAKPEMVQKIGNQAQNEDQTVSFILLSSGLRGSGQDTKKSPMATKYSLNKKGVSQKIPESIYVEIGRRPYALVIKDLKLVKGKINLWDYSDYFTRGPIITKQGGSTICAVGISSRSHENKMKSNIRNMVAQATLVEPYAVWLS